jgi:ElaB/YqjD/DUF883 family membrane-anchored ribosome-binding protein
MRVDRLSREASSRANHLVEGIAERSRALASDAGSHAHHLQESARRVTDKIASTVSPMAEWVGGRAHRIGHSGSSALASARQRARDYPLATFGIALALGVLISILARNRTRFF